MAPPPRRYSINWLKTLKLKAATTHKQLTSGSNRNAASQGLAGLNQKLSNFARKRTIADNPAMSRPQANEVNTDSQVERKQA
jgi:hypothetical protein